MKKVLVKISALIICVLLVASSTCFAATKTATSAKTTSNIQMVLDLTVKANGSSSFVNKQVVTDDQYESYSSNITAFNQKYSAYGMKFKMVKENGKNYLAITQETKKNEPITFGASGNQDYTYRFAEKKGLFGKTYFVTAPFDMRQSLEDKPTTTEILQFTVNLPFGAKYSNATKVENMGRKLIWSGFESAPNPVYLVFFIPNFVSIIIFVIILILIIFFIIKFIKKRNMKDDIIVPDAVLENAEFDGEIHDADLGDENVEASTEEVTNEVEKTEEIKEDNE